VVARVKALRLIRKVHFSSQVTKEELWNKTVKDLTQWTLLMEALTITTLKKKIVTALRKYKKFI